MNNERKTEILVGVFLLAGLLMLGGLIMEFGSLRTYFRDTYELKVAFPNASGIKMGSPVFLGGSKVGKVLVHPELNETFTGVIMTLEIFDSVDIPLDASFAIGSKGLMGDALVEIKPSGKLTDQFLPHDYDEIIEGAKSGGLSDLQGQAEVVAKKVDLVLDDVRTALVDVKAAMVKINKDALADTTIQDFKESMEHLNKTMTRVDEQVLGDENATNLKTAIADMKDAAASFKVSAKNVEATTEKLGPMVDKLDPVIAKADKAMGTADETLKSVKTAADSFSVAARNITSGKGLLGALTNDAELKNEFKDLIFNLKRNGVIFYRNSAEKERARDEPPASATKPVFPLRR
ncbi:MlaD family protein [Prosthecobacter sp. SYSU 5D2]|uniref:MlaD family protein n=1 Tax=Prosthecobacter sp. SYSU 5D2 TaxID=3134134 RepID=UPI0031FEB968